MSGQPYGLSTTLPLALAELKKDAGLGASIMIDFDRGGAYPQVFRHCREQEVHWVTYRRAPLAVPAMLHVLTTLTSGGKTREIDWAVGNISSRTTTTPGRSPCSRTGRSPCRS